jgi:HAD superfamily hydrolase (TIGR01484 family)
VPAAFDLLAVARAAGLRIVPITGRPAGWVDHIARMWPVDGVVGENGGLWFAMRDGKLQRSFLQDAPTRARNRAALDEIASAILEEVPGTALASDQPYRELDLAIDFCEDVPPLPEADVDRIVDAFHARGATCKVSSIHVNGWFGTFDKVDGCRRFLAEHFDEDLDEVAGQYAFFGDSANDEPMFGRFGLSIGVANVQRFLPRMRSWPRFVTASEGGFGFAEGTSIILDRLTQLDG